MDWGGSHKISTHMDQRWGSANQSPNWTPSLFQRKVKGSCWLFGGSVVKSQLHPKVLKLKSSDIIWTGVVHTKFQLIWLIPAPTKRLEYWLTRILDLMVPLERKSKSALQMLAENDVIFAIRAFFDPPNPTQSHIFILTADLSSVPFSIHIQW